MSGPDHFRYRDVLNDSGQILVEEQFQVIRATPAGYWVRRMYGHRITDPALLESVYKNRRVRDVHFVLKSSSRRYCYPTRLEAMKAFACRKAAQVKHAETSLAKARHALAAANRLATVGNDYPASRWGSGSDIHVGMPPEFAHLSFY